MPFTLNLARNPSFLNPVTWTHSDSLTKPLSSLYKELFQETTVLMQTCRLAWETVAPGLGRDDWDDMWGTAFQCLVSTRDCLIHYKFLHRTYLTPARLARMFGNQHSLCWRYSAPLAKSIHIFWDCPQIRPCWQTVAQCIQSVTSISIPISIEVCLLHLVEPLDTTRAI